VSRLPADGTAGPTVIPVADATDTGAPSLDWGTRVITAGLAIDLDAAILVEAMADAHLRHTRDSILAGERPDGGGPQDPLRARTLADPDRQSPHRGYKTGTLADEIYRTPIESTGNEASCRILPPRARFAYVGKERKLGRELITVRGAAGEAAAKAAREVAVEMMTGSTIAKNGGETAAKEAKT
jgi:hypothetical protein